MSEFNIGDKVEPTIRIFTNPTIPAGAECKVLGRTQRIGREYLVIEGPCGQRAVHPARIFRRVA